MLTCSKHGTVEPVDGSQIECSKCHAEKLERLDPQAALRYILLSEGDVFEEGDEMYSYGTAWTPIPKQWIGMKLSYRDNNTLSRFMIPIRRRSIV